MAHVPEVSTSETEGDNIFDFQVVEDNVVELQWQAGELTSRNRINLRVTG